MTTSHGPFDTRIFHKECITLAKEGFEVVLIVPHVQNGIFNGVKIKKVPKPKSRPERMTRIVWKEFHLALKENATVYHLHDPELIPAGILLKLFDKKVIYDVHEDYVKQTLSKEYIPKSARKIIALAVKLSENILSRFFDGVVTATDDILKNFSYRNKAVSVRNFPVTARFSETGKKGFDSQGIFTLIYAGGLSEIRGITHVVRSLELVDHKKNTKLLLCGEFYPSGYEAKVKSLSGFKKVEYLGFVNIKMIPDLLSRANAGIVCFMPEPNHINAMPNKLFEYMTVGLPVIASDFPLWKEIVEGNRCGICADPSEPKEIAKAIEYLIEHPNEANQMGENGRKAVLEKYNWESESKKLIEFYAHL